MALTNAVVHVNRIVLPVGGIELVCFFSMLELDAKSNGCSLWLYYYLSH